MGVQFFGGSSTYSEPFELDIPAIIASGSSPNSTPSGAKKATLSPKMTAMPNFATSKTIPFSTEGSAERKLI